MRAFGWTQLEGFVAASAALEGPAKRWLESRPELSTWEDVKKVLLEEFDRKTSVARLHELMAARKRKKNESLVDYLQEMKALGREAGMEDKDILRYVIRGVTDDETLKIILSSCRSVEELRDRYEDALDLVQINQVETIIQVLQEKQSFHQILKIKKKIV